MKKRVLLLGLGRANISVAEHLLDKGSEVFLYEENPAALSSYAKRLIADGKIKMHESGDYNYDRVVASPGFPPDKEVFQKLKANNVPVIDEIEYTYQTLDNPDIIAVTGTNGKSTTAALISNILFCAGIKSFLGGNLAPGMPFSRSLLLPKFDYYVLEVSSFQLMRIKYFHSHITVLTNISVDHLNWHGSFEEYKEAKMRLFKNQTKDDFAVLNYDDRFTQELLEKIACRVVFFGRSKEADLNFNGDFYFQNKKLFPLEVSQLIGIHNMLNTSAAIAVAKILEICERDIEEGVMTFKALPHRLEDLGIRNRIQYINNSMCTNIDAAIASFKAVKGNKIVIIGGREKGEKGDRYLDLLIEQAKACVILGENAQYIADYFERHNYRTFTVVEDMTRAVQKARTFAADGDIIFLNPGFASFGNFKDFEERGEAFKDVVYND